MAQRVIADVASRPSLRVGRPVALPPFRLDARRQGLIPHGLSISAGPVRPVIRGGSHDEDSGSDGPVLSALVLLFMTFDGVIHLLKNRAGR